MRTRSPFPGMDPWLEGYWGSVHPQLINHYADQIQSQLPEGLFADIEVTVYITEEINVRGNVIPDVAVLGDDQPWSDKTDSRSDSDAAVAAPFKIKIPSEPVEQGHVVIRSLKDHQPLITVIEVLSPTNNVDHRGRSAYVLKRQEYYRARTNLIEVDLLRSGVELVDVPAEELPQNLLTPYKAVVRRARPRDFTEAEYYAMPLQEKLLRISIPLRPNDADVILDFQAAIDHAYTGGRYGGRIDYSKPPRPSLWPDEAAWAADMISKST